MAVINLKVTQEHIDKGERESECSCPIALALKECSVYNIPIKEVNVQGGNKKDINLTTENGYHWRLSESYPKINDFVRDFDLGLKVEPFELKIEFDELDGSEEDF